MRVQLVELLPVSPPPPQVSQREVGWKFNQSPFFSGVMGWVKTPHLRVDRFIYITNTP
jgi:hypothetical protein